MRVAKHSHGNIKMASNSDVYYRGDTCFSLLFVFLMFLRILLTLLPLSLRLRLHILLVLPLLFEHCRASFFLVDPG